MKAILLLTAIMTTGAWAGATTSGSVAVNLEERWRHFDAVISGPEERGIYRQLPPLLVEFERIDRGTEVWIEVHQGAGTLDRPGIILQGARLLRSKDGSAVMDGPGLGMACSHDGTWTVMVLSKTVRGTVCLGKSTFTLQRQHAEVARGLAHPGAKS